MQETQNEKQGQLILVPTPIGNRSDITLRALEVLRAADVIACEDTRHSAPLLDGYDIHRPLISYHMHNEQERSEELLGRVEQGERVAVISDAGMPGVSDPGGVLVQKAIARGLSYTVLPGASAVTVAAVAAGLGDGRFAFLGFLPRSGKEREQALTFLDTLPITALCYESPFRIRKTILEMGARWPDRHFALLREWSKQYEEALHYTGHEAESLSFVEKGEFVLAIGPAIATDTTWSDAAVCEALERLESNGLSPKAAMKQVMAESGRSRNAIYRLREENRRSN